MASTSKTAATTKSILESATTLQGHGEQIRSISYFPDGQRMISGSDDKTARQWDLKAFKEIEEARGVFEKGVWAVAVSRDGRWIVTSGDDDTGELKACEVETGIVKSFKGHSKWINGIDISADSTLLASVSDDTTARIWDLETGKLVAGPFKSVDSVGAVRFPMDSKKLAINSDVGRCLEVWDVRKQTLDVRKGKRSGTGITYAPIFWTHKDKNILAAFSFTDGDAKTIYEFDASTLETVGASFTGHTGRVTGLALSSQGNFLVSCSSHDDSIKLWAFESRQLLASFDVQNPETLVFSPDSRQLACTTSTYNDHNIYICATPPDVLAQLASTNARKKSTLNDLRKFDATRRPPVVHRRQPIPAIPMSQRPPPTINPQQPIFLRLRKFLSFSSRTNEVPIVQNNQTRSPLDFPATSPLPPNRLRAEHSPSTTLPNFRTIFNPIRSSSDNGKQKVREPKRKHAQVVDVPLGQATYADVIGVDDGKRQYVLLFCLSWFQKKEKRQVPRPVYDDELDNDEEDEDVFYRVAVPHPRVQDEGIGLTTVASQPQPRAGSSRLTNNDDILNRVAVPHPRRVRDEDIALKTAASQSQPGAGPSLLVNNVDILNRVAVPHPRVQDEDIGLKTVASRSQSRAGPSRRLKNDDILNRVAVRPPRVQPEEIELKPVASQSQPEAGPSRLTMIDEHLEAQSS